MGRILIFLFIYLLCSSFIGKKITWVAIGDSITYLNNHIDETGNRITKGYLTMVVEKDSNIHYVNKGYNGWTAGNIASEIEKIDIPKAELYTIFLGTNDWWQGRPVGTLEDYIKNSGNQTFYGSLRIIIEKLHALNPKAKIILITPMQRADFVYWQDFKNNAYGSYKEKNGQRLESFAAAVVAIGKYDRTLVVDLYHDKRLDISKLVNFKFLKNPKTNSYVKYKYPDYIDIPFDPIKDNYPYPKGAQNLTYDGLHPTEKGYRIISSKLSQYISANNSSLFK